MKSNKSTIIAIIFIAFLFSFIGFIAGLNYNLGKSYNKQKHNLDNIMEELGFEPASGDSLIHKEAREKAEQYFDTKIANCGYGFYIQFKSNKDFYNENGRYSYSFNPYASDYPDVIAAMDSNSIMQIKSHRFDIYDKGLTEADELNGYEFNGSFELNFQSYRIYSNKDTKWTDWKAHHTRPGFSPYSDTELDQIGFYKKMDNGTSTKRSLKYYYKNQIALNCQSNHIVKRQLDNR